MRKIKLFLLSFIALFTSLTTVSCATGANKKAPESDAIFKANDLQEEPEEEVKTNFEIKLLYLPVKWGDCTLITYKDKHILVDAGGSTALGKKNKLGCPEIIYNAIKDLDTIDYMIFTHADSDHICNFANENGVKKWLSDPNANHTIKNFIDFDNKENRDFFKKDDNPNEFGNLYLKYTTYRDEMRIVKKIKNYYTAAQCIADGKRFFPFEENGSDGIRILDNYFYTHHLSKNKSDRAAQRNLLSVCFTIEVNGHTHLFTGDLEEFNSSSTLEEANDEGFKPYKRIYGESFLVANNYEYLKDGVDFYKAAHHGSYTSNSSVLLDTIRPKYIGIPTSVHGQVNKFPSNVAVRNMLKWTDYIYPTGIKNPGEDSDDIDNSNVENLYNKKYGDVILKYDIETDETIFTSSELESFSTNKSMLADDYLTQRTADAYIYSLGDIDKTGHGVFFDFDENYVFPKDAEFKECKESVANMINYKEDIDYGYKKYSNATYIKLGHIDILINFGQVNDGTDVLLNNIEKVDKLCNDHVLDYLILSNYNNESINCLVSNDLKHGLLYESNIKKIEHLYHFGLTPYTLKKEDSKIKQIDAILNSPLLQNAEIKSSNELNNTTINILNLRVPKGGNFVFQIRFLDMGDNIDSKLESVSTDDRKHSLQFIVEMYYQIDENKTPTQLMKYLNIGCVEYLSELEDVVARNKDLLKDITVFDLMSHGIFQYDGENPDADECSRQIVAFKKIFGSQLFGEPNILFNGSYDYHTDELKYKIYTLGRKYIYANGLLDPNNHDRELISGGNVIFRYSFGYFHKTTLEKYLIYGINNVNYFTEKVESFSSLNSLGLKDSPKK